MPYQRRQGRNTLRRGGFRETLVNFAGLCHVVTHTARWRSWDSALCHVNATDKYADLKTSVRPSQPRRDTRLRYSNVSNTGTWISFISTPVPAEYNYTSLSSTPVSAEYNYTSLSSTTLPVEYNYTSLNNTPVPAEYNYTSLSSTTLAAEHNYTSLSSTPLPAEYNYTSLSSTTVPS